MVVRRVKDRELSETQLSQREESRRRFEIDAQIVNALEKGNPVELLLTHPAGLMPNRNKGASKPLHADLEQERLFIVNRYNQLKAKWEAGNEFEEIDAEITSEVQKGKRKGDPRLDRLSEIKVRGVKSKKGQNGEKSQKFARARAHKDFKELLHQEDGVAKGWMRELSNDELIAEHEEGLAKALERTNKYRATIGLGPIRFVEE